MKNCLKSVWICWCTICTNHVICLCVKKPNCTVFFIYVGPASVVDQVTGHLKLYWSLSEQSSQRVTRELWCDQNLNCDLSYKMGVYVDDPDRGWSNPCALSGMFLDQMKYISWFKAGNWSSNSQLQINENTSKQFSSRRSFHSPVNYEWLSRWNVLEESIMCWLITSMGIFK